MTDIEPDDPSRFVYDTREKAEEELTEWFPRWVEEAARPELCRIAILEHPRRGGVSLFSIHEDFVTMTVSDLGALATWVTADEAHRGTLTGVPRLLLQLSALGEHHISLVKQINELTAHPKEHQMSDPISVNPDVVQHQGTLTITVDFRASLPPTEFLDGATLDEALDKFADLQSIKDAITKAPRVEGISIESIEFGLGVNSYLTS